MDTKIEETSTEKYSTSELLKQISAKLAKAEKSLTAKAAAHTAAKKKVSDLTAARERLSIESQKQQLRALGVSDPATFAALLDHAKRTGFKSPSFLPVSSPR